MEHIIVLFILALCFFSFFYFLYHVLVKLQNKENFSDEYKLMVASCVVFVFILINANIRMYRNDHLKMYKITL